MIIGKLPDCRSVLVFILLITLYQIAQNLFSLYNILQREREADSPHQGHPMEYVMTVKYASQLPLNRQLLKFRINAFA